MKVPYIVITILFCGFTLTCCGNSGNLENRYISFAEKALLENSSANVAQDQDIYDDQQSTVYIKIDTGGGTDERIKAIMKKKGMWEKQFPNKKIVSISIVADGYRITLISGLLIHYENQHTSN